MIIMMVIEASPTLNRYNELGGAQQKRYNVNKIPVQHCAVWTDDVEGNGENKGK